MQRGLPAGVVWGDDNDEDEDTDVFVALRSYQACNSDELSFSEGDAILVLSSSDDGLWLLGELRGRTGRFPSSHVGTKM